MPLQKHYSFELPELYLDPTSQDSFFILVSGHIQNYTNLNHQTASISSSGSDVVFLSFNLIQKTYKVILVRRVGCKPNRRTAYSVVW
jgi:hypothetical protein